GTRARARAARGDEPVREGKLVTASPKPTSGTQKRFRGVDDEPRRRSAGEAPTGTGLPPGWPLAARLAGDLVLGLVALLSPALTGGRPPRDEDEPQPKKEVQGQDDAKGLVNRALQAQAGGPEGLHRVGRVDEADLARLRADFEGPQRQF